MFSHIFFYRIKSLLRQRSLVFWTLIFPIALATFFNISLSNVMTIDQFEPISVAVVNDPAYPAFIETMKGLSEGEDRLFDLTLGDKVKAYGMLKDGEISGYIVAGVPPELVVAKTGINQSILKNFLDQYTFNLSTIETLAAQHPESIPELMSAMSARENFIEEVSVTDKPTDPSLVYFYALIAMACLYGSLYGIEEVNRVQANLTTLAARLNVSPVHKLKVFAAGMLAAIVIHYTGLLALLAYMQLALGVGFGDQIGVVALIVLIGSILGISMGAVISALIKKGEGLKVAVVLLISMLGSFMAGMMIADIKYFIAQKMPILGYINPANLLSDALYALYYYDTYTRLYQNLAGMSAFALLFCALTYLLIRGRKYASL